ncbi:TonB-dependent receptor SusC [Kordia sp. SMS9]|uniref:carboxypeptidase-like regulatory domain-containing protein n=1 Tax=Kordia sp. SMS9 TaxID=2282170 RepID=UPI000E0DEEE5|nr:carboxypeptidase-like regulatory domain-containing protein [Kordia sp. SMS9]AXG69395.1 TonB-dependent receptor SusC [Kordia sp. SMS9]
MKKTATILISFLFACTAFAQYEITIDAYILDRDTNEPIPHVNVEFPDKDIKAVTDVSGKFTLTFDEGWIRGQDSFQLSANNYKTVTTVMSKLDRYLSVSDKIYLKMDEASQNKNTITGVVAAEKDLTIQNASVQIKNTFITAHTNFDGEFDIAAKVGDTLVIDYLGMNSKEVVVRDRNPIDITLKSDRELLKEVALKGKKKQKKKEYVDTGFGAVNLDTFSPSTVINSEDIGPQHIYTSDVLRGSVAGLFVYNGGVNTRPRYGISPQQMLRNTNPTPIESASQTLMLIRGQQVQVFYDGFPFRGSVDDIELRTIDNIVILKSINSTILYGGLPTILITSKNRFLKKDANGNVVNSALLTNNNYKEAVPLIMNKEEKPLYILELETAKSYQQAMTIFGQQQQNSLRQTIPYYLDTAEYFKRWGKDKSLAILKNIEVLAEENPRALKSLAYKLEELDEFVLAKSVYQRIAALLPNASQSYRDLALAYKRAGNYQESLDLYVKMLTDSFETIDFSGIEKPLLSEMQQLLRRHRVELDYKDIPSNLLKATFKYDVRLVVEWNRPNAEFELQFVNPSKKFYTWEHSILANKDRLLDEAKNGYHMEEHIIDEADITGDWIVNIKSLEEEENINPTYLKYTLYTNYGAPNQERTIKVVKLYKHQQKVTLDKIKYQPQASSTTQR